MPVRHPIFRKVLLNALLLVALALVIVAFDLRTRGILEAAVVAGLAALGFSYVFSASIGRRISRLRDFAQGGTDQGHIEIEKAAEDELGVLARSLDGMASRLGGLAEGAKVDAAQRESILATMVEGVLAVDLKLRITFSNRSFAEAVGAQHPIRDGTPLPEVVRGPSLSELLTEVLKEREPQEKRLGLVLGGEERIFVAQAAPLASPAGPGAIAVLYDITPLERLERVRRDFVANVSHELRTPLTAIRGYAETLLEGGLEDVENSRHFVEIIKAHAIRLGNITSDLLTLSELESGAASSPAERVSVQAAVDSSMRTVNTAARLARVRLVRGEVEEADVLGSRTHLEQVLVNLLDNAVKFNRPDGEVRIETRCSPDSQVTIVVSDTGVGIPSELLSRIFERFYRVDKARSREAGGTGLGLSIVKHIVERMNGTVTVASDLGRGSKFTVTLPRCA
ncbi:MAG TPA: ATP-binding protein [Terriglobia bacterium]|jgi:two-component system phosphate regulon sensor histidine kinase PhoR|nr:ATP-binding protein [Terriglobia bacterium]